MKTFVVAVLAALSGGANAAPALPSMEEVVRRLSAVEGGLAAVEAENVALRERVAQLEATGSSDVGINSTAPRRLQRTGNAGGAREVRIYTRELSRQAGGGRTGTTAGGGHRRAQAGGTCDVDARTAAVSAECCDEPGESCTNGAPASCNADCASELLPMWADCEDMLDKHVRAAFHAVVRECQEAVVEREMAAGDETLAMQLMLSCDGGEETGDCVPACNADLHGDLLLANIDGEDSKYSCELHHSKYSWMGSAADGGYLGSDLLAVVASVLSGAAGEYNLAVEEDGDIDTDVTIEPGMHVSIRGDAGLVDAPSWGRGSFTVAEKAMLWLMYIKLDIAATISVIPGGSVSLADLALLAGQLDWTDDAGSTLSLSNVAFDGPSIEVGVPCRDKLKYPFQGGPDCDHCPSAPGKPGGCNHIQGACDAIEDYGVTIVPSSDAIASGVIDFLAPQGETYSDWSQCQWTVDCPGAIFELTHLDAEGGFDIITMPDGQQISGSMVGVQPDYRAHGSDSSTISFESDLDTGGRGFRLNWRCPGGTPLTQKYTVATDGHSLTSATPDVTLAFQCFQPYTPFFTEGWRSPTSLEGQGGGPLHCDANMGDQIAFDDRWFRFAGDAGDAIATRDPFQRTGNANERGGSHFCGSSGIGWLSDADEANGTPSSDNAIPGTLPRTEEGAKPMIVCFDREYTTSLCPAFTVSVR